MTRDNKGRFATSKKWIYIVIVLFVSGYVVWAYNVKTHTVEYIAPVNKVLSGIEEIANRPDIKYQQQLIVKEQFIKEEKAKKIEEKKNAIADFDTKIAQIQEAKKLSIAEFDKALQDKETELEAIRKEKTSF